MASSGTLRVRILGDSGPFEKTIGGLGGKLSTAMKGLGAIGLAGGAVFAKGFFDAANIDKANDKLAAQLDLTAKESERAGDIAGSLYADAYGGSIEEVNSALGGVQANIGDLSSFSNAALEGMGAKALDLASIMGEDVSRVTRGVGQLMRNDLAPNAEAAFDIIAAAQAGLSEDMKGELLDTIEEYGADFASLGLTGEQAMGALSAAVDAGARNVDLAADAFREFSIRAIDGSDLSAQAFQDLGFDAEDMAAKIAGGGPAASEATSEIIQALSSITDPVKREAAGVALFGTRFEELGIDAIEAMDPMVAGLDDVNGAAERMGDTLNDNLATKVEGLKRGLWQAVTEGVTPLVNALSDNMPAIQDFAENAIAFIGRVITDRVIPAFRTLSDWWAENGPTVMERVRAVKDAIVTFGETVAEWWTGTVRPYLNAFVDAVRENWPTVESAMENLGDAFDSFKDVAKSALDIVQAVFGNTAEVTSDETASMQADVRDVINILDAFAGGTAKVARGVSNRMEILAGAFTGDTDRIYNASLRLAEEAFPGMAGAAYAMVGDIKLAVRDIVDQFLGLPGRITAALGNLSSLLVEAGRDLIRGFMGGIRSMASDVAAEARDVARRASNAVTSFLGISSPSKLFFTFGEQTMQGYIDGAKAKGEEVEKTMSDIFKEVSGGVSTIIGGIGSIGGRGGAQQALADAQAELTKLMARRTKLPAAERGLRNAIAAEREQSEAVDPEEEAAIIRARQRVADAEQDLADVRADKEAGLDDLRLAEIEVGLARERLTEAEKAAHEPSRRLIELQEQLRELKEESAGIDAEILAAREALTAAELSAVTAEQRLLESGRDLIGITPDQQEMFRKLAESAGLTTNAIDQLINRYQTLARITGSGGSVDDRIIGTGSWSALAGRIRDIFRNRGVGIAANGETEDQRIARIVSEVQAGRSLDDVRQSVDRLARLNNVTVNVAGSVVSERELVDAVRQGLLRERRGTPSLGLS